MITYHSNKFGLWWEFELHENTFVIWHGHKPSSLSIPRKDFIKLYERYGSIDAVHTEFIHTRLQKGSFCDIEQKPIRNPLRSPF